MAIQHTDIYNSLIAECHHLAAEQAPHEACGLLIGQRCGMGVQIERLAASRNVTGLDPRYFFEVDPVLLLEWHKQSRQQKSQIVGVWHSHPSGLAEPSSHDQSRSCEPDWIWLISAPVQRGQDIGRWVTKAWLADSTVPHQLKALEMRIVSD